MLKLFQKYFKKGVIMANITELIPFNNACDEFISGKYILAEAKIKTIMKIISEDEKIRDIISSCVESTEFGKILSNSLKEIDDQYVLEMPNDDKDIVSLVYGLLYRFDSKQLDFYDFLSRFNSQDESSNQFNHFATNIIVPFKNSVNSIYSKRHVIVEAQDYQVNYYNKIKNCIRLIMNNIDNLKLKIDEKEEFTMLLNSLYIASDKNDKKLVFSLTIALDYFSRYNKKTRPSYLSIEECFLK